MQNGRIARAGLIFVARCGAAEEARRIYEDTIPAPSKDK